MAINRDDFFDAKAKGALWDVGVSIKRGNPLPIDAYSVFESLEAAQVYAAGVLSYPGQVLAVVNADSTIIYYLDQNCSLVEVGGKVTPDNKSIEVNSSGEVAIKGVADAESGAVLTRQADGSVNWIVPDATTVEGLTTRLGVAEGEIDTLQTELASLLEVVGSAEAGLVKDVADLKTSVDTHIADKNNPHAVTAEQIGLGNVTNDAQVKRSEMGVANGVATLDADGKVPASQLPSFVDDVVEVENYEALPVTGEAAKIYVTLNDNKTYRWGGSAYVEISASLALGETAETAYAGDKGKANADAIALLKGGEDQVGSVAHSIKTKIESLDKEDTVVDGQFVTSVSETDGIITVTRGALKATDIPTIEIAKVNGLQAALDAKATEADLTALESVVGDSESRTGIFAEIDALETDLKAYADQAEADAITTAGTNADAKITAAIGTGYSGTVKQYIDNINNTLTGRIDTTDGNVSSLATRVEALETSHGELGELAHLDKVAEVNLDEELAAKINNKADKATTLAGYGITDAYTSATVDTKLSETKNAAVSEAGTAADAKISAKVGDITGTVKDYVDAVDAKVAANTSSITTVSGKVTAIENTIAGYGDIVTHNVDEFATAAQGALAASALQQADIVEGSANGTISVKGADVKVKGLGSAAYTESSAYDPAGSAAAVLGDSGDGSSELTVYGVKKYAEELISANDAVVLKGTLGTDGTVTTLPTEGYKVGWMYRVATAGVYAGHRCEVGDSIYCVKDYVDTANNDDWAVIQGNIDGAVVNTTGASDLHVAIFSGTSGNVIKDSGFTIGTSVPADAKFTDTTYEEATGSQAGLMSAADKTKLDGISAQATKVEKSDINGNIKIDGSETVVYTLPSEVLKSTDVLILNGGNASTSYEG